MDVHISDGRVELTIERYEELREIERQRNQVAVCETSWINSSKWTYKGKDKFIQEAIDNLNSARSYYMKAKEESVDNQKKFWNEQIQQRSFRQRLRFLFNPKSLLVD